MIFSKMFDHLHKSWKMLLDCLEKVLEAIICEKMVSFSTFYESFRGNLVDGSPPARHNTGAVEGPHGDLSQHLSILWMLGN